MTRREHRAAGTADRYASLVTRIGNSTDEGALSTTWVLSRIDKANGVPYCTGGDPLRPMALNTKLHDLHGNIHKCADISTVRHEDILQSPDGKPDRATYSTGDALATRLKGITAYHTYRKHKKNSTEAHIIPNEGFGLFLEKQFKEMKVGVRAGFVEATDHVFNARFRKKVVAGARLHVASLFDSNHTNRDQRVEKSSARELQPFGLRDFMHSAEDYAFYFEDGRKEECAIYMQAPDKPAGRSEADRVIPCTIDVPFSGQTLGFVLDGNLALDMDWAREQLRLAPQAAVSVLQAELKGRAKGLSLAIQNDCVEAIQAYGQLLSFALRDPGCRAVLQGKVAALLDVTTNGMKGLQSAMHHGSSAVVEPYGGLVLDAHARGDIDVLELRDLLDCGSDSGASGLFVAAALGKDEFIHAYLTLLEQAPHAVRAELIALKAEGGASGIATALRQHDAALTTMLCTILKAAHQRKLITAFELSDLSIDDANRNALDETLADPASDRSASAAFVKHAKYVVRCLENAPLAAVPPPSGG
jgi:hypothetical protein